MQNAAKSEYLLYRDASKTAKLMQDTQEANSGSMKKILSTQNTKRMP
jgi:hypothetical protein